MGQIHTEPYRIVLDRIEFGYRTAHRTPHAPHLIGPRLETSSASSLFDEEPSLQATGRFSEFSYFSLIYRLERAERPTRTCINTPVRYEYMYRYSEYQYTSIHLSHKSVNQNAVLESPMILSSHDVNRTWAL